MSSAISTRISELWVKIDETSCLVRNLSSGKKCHPRKWRGRDYAPYRRTSVPPAVPVAVDVVVIVGAARDRDAMLNALQNQKESNPAVEATEPQLVRSGGAAVRYREDYQHDGNLRSKPTTTQ
jgi:hypothetical protein